MLKRLADSIFTENINAFDFIEIENQFIELNKKESQFLDFSAMSDSIVGFKHKSRIVTGCIQFVCLPNKDNKQISVFDVDPEVVSS